MCDILSFCTSSYRFDCGQSLGGSSPIQLLNELQPCLESTQPLALKGRLTISDQRGELFILNLFINCVFSYANLKFRIKFIKKLQCWLKMVVHVIWRIGQGICLAKGCVSKGRVWYQRLYPVKFMKKLTKISAQFAGTVLKFYKFTLFHDLPIALWSHKTKHKHESLG